MRSKGEFHVPHTGAKAGLIPLGNLGLPDFHGRPSPTPKLLSSMFLGQNVRQIFRKIHLYLVLDMPFFTLSINLLIFS
ncbi:Uncharacterised protein [Streptococcus pneumoniae]|nr:Uncharacterised protein [Streptococcus pneumoniae]